MEPGINAMRSVEARAVFANALGAHGIERSTHRTPYSTYAAQNGFNERCA